MTYAVGGLIQASDFNGFVNSVNTVWSTGSTNSGYGQTAIATVTTGNLIYASEYNSLLSRIANIASHQGTTLSSLIDSNPQTGELVFYESNLQNNVTLIQNNRLNAATQGSTSTSTITNSSITWSNSLTMSWTVAFSNDNAARFFFNGGGQFALTFSHPSSGAPINTTFSSLASRAGTVVLSSPTGSNTATIVGTSYTGVTKIGGASASTVNTQNGFYALTASDQLLMQQRQSSGYSYYGNSVIEIYARYNGTGTLVITVLWDEIPNGLTVSTGSVGNLTLRNPETTYLTNSWGTPAITTSVTGS